MAPHALRALLAASTVLASTVSALNAAMVGTWTTKSAKVLTGPGFYNPINDSFIEPALTGISYSFSADGFYEEAYYRSISNPVVPSCPSSLLQFQHGTVVEKADGSLVLTPFGVDGRQQLSSPCRSAHSTYSRYNQTQNMQKYAVYVDSFQGVKRLDLYQFDGKPLNPMFLAYTPPLMLPTQTMNPTTAAAAATGKVKRSMGTLAGVELPLNKDATHIKRTVGRAPLDEDLIWWAGLGMTLIGGAAYML